VTGLPYPTPTRLRLADAIAANQVKHYHWINPWTCDTARDAAVTSRVAELVRAGLAEIPDPSDDLPESLVQLTPDGMAWVTRARTREEGPVSTSPETGPGWVDEATGLKSGGLVAACSVCGSLDHYEHPAECTCPPLKPNHGTRENRGHLLGCPMLRAKSTKDEERTEGGA